jgi:MOSC domain-containing protein YiiM
MSGAEKKGEIVGVCVSHHRRAPKKNIDQGLLKEGLGLEGDSHAGTEREISLLSSEDVEEVCRARGIRALPGSFAENIRTQDIDLGRVQIGERIRLGEATVEVVALGKDPSEPHPYGYCGISLLPEKGVFARVVVGGSVRVGDAVEIMIHSAATEAGDQNKSR